jgi:hypothetical protein
VSPAAPVVGRVLKLANEVHGLARTAGRTDVQEALAEQAARWTDAATTVVLAGAQKRGKSRLLNALVARPDLLPVDADIATTTQITLRHGGAPQVVVHRTVTGPDGSPRTVASEIDPGQLGRSRPWPAIPGCCGRSPASRWCSTSPCSTVCASSTRRASTA